MDAQSARQIAREAAEAAVSEVLLKLGINVEDPNEVILFQQDLGAIREFVRALKDLRSKGTTALVLLVLSALATALWIGIKAAVR